MGARGTDQHAYEPSARERRRILEADLLVVNGADLEEGLVDLLDEAEREGIPTLVAMDAVEPLHYPAVNSIRTSGTTPNAPVKLNGATVSPLVTGRHSMRTVSHSLAQSVGVIPGIRRLSLPVVPARNPTLASSVILLWIAS